MRMISILFLAILLSLTAANASILDNFSDKAVDGVADNSEQSNHSDMPEIVNKYQKQCLNYPNCRLIGPKELLEREGIWVSEDITYCELASKKRIHLCWKIIHQLENKNTPQKSAILLALSELSGTNIYVAKMLY